MTTHRVAAGLTLVYGLVAAIGGTIGFIKAGSVASLVAGGGSGLLLIASAALIGKKPKLGLIGAIVLSLLLIGRFASAVAKGGASPIAMIMIAGGAAVLVAAGVALTKSSPAAR